MQSSASSRTTRKTETASTALEVAGGLILAVAFALLRLWLGLAVLGMECIVFGIALSMIAPPAPSADFDGA